MALLYVNELGIKFFQFLIVKDRLMLVLLIRHHQKHLSIIKMFIYF